MRIAITGAYSYTGKYIAGRLLERGEQLITLILILRLRSTPNGTTKQTMRTVHVSGSQVACRVRVMINWVSSGRFPYHMTRN